MRRSIEWRLRFVLGSNPFPLSDRLRGVLVGGMRLSAEDLIKRRHRRGPEGDEFYQMGTDRFYFRSDLPIRNTSLYRRNMELLLREAFFDPDWFSSDVRIQPGDIVLDLGGAIGTCALAFSRLVGQGGHVFTFEPLTHGPLRRNMEVNGAANVTVVPKAVGATEGLVTMMLADSGIDASFARSPGGPGRPVNEIPVEGTTIDRFADEQRLSRVDFMKLDIEGAEELALRGAQRTLERFGPRLSIASYHHDHRGEWQHPKLVRLLRDFGYQVVERGQKRIYAQPK